MEIEEIILQVKNLSISFLVDNTYVQAIENISFDLLKGKSIAIVGESGSGKSVTSLCIMQLLHIPPARIDSGNILLNNKLDILQCSENEMANLRGNEIAMIFQEPMTSLNPLMKCGKQVAEAIIKHKNISFIEAKKKVIQLFEEVKIPNPEIAYDKYPHEMSGGQKQRVMIAMALSCEPKIIIADEPTTALDVTVQNEIIELFKTIQKTRATAIIFITHDLALVKNFAHHTIVMYKGKIVEQNETTTLFSNPQENYTKALLYCRPSLKERILELPTIDNFLNTEISFQKNIESREIFNTRQQFLQTKNIVFEIQNLSIKYASKKNLFGQAKEYFHALKNINLKIFEGETIGIIGESGCGKTTLGKALVKLNPISDGFIKYLNKDIFQEWDISYHQEVQIIFQDPYSSLNPRITIGKAIEEPMHVHNIGAIKNRKKTVETLLEKVGLLSEHYNRYAHEFSGGQRQRICIARALAMKAKVIICDESVSALDVSVQAQVLNLLASLRKEFGLTLLFISHDMNVIRHLSDRIIVMQNGIIVEENNAYDLFENPKNGYTRTLLDAVPA